MPAPIGNKYTQIYTKEAAIELFLKGLEYATTSAECLSLADAIHHTGIPYSTYDYLAEKHEVLGLIKKDTKVEVTRGINKGALLSDFQPASAIWRMKQLGETDKSEIKQINIEGKALSKEEIIKVSASLDKDV